MLTRLRQRTQTDKGSIQCKISMNGTSWSQSSTMLLPVSFGSIQAVWDEGASTPSFKRNRNAVPPLREVKMSKVEFSVPQKGPVIYKHVGRDYNWVFSGDSVAASPFTNGMSTGFTPPTNALNLQFTQVDPHVASYLLQRAYSKMSTAEYDFGVTVGEVAETASMLAGPLRGIAKLSTIAFAGIQAIYKSGPKVVVKVANNATTKQLKVIKASTIKHPIHTSLRMVDESANHWLAYKFGVCPFIDDVDKVLSFAEENVVPKFGLQVARVKGWSNDTTTSELKMNNAVYSNSYETLIFDVFATKRIIDFHTCGLYWRNKIDAPLVNFLENIGLSPFQLPSLAYELVPLSFVVDRFIDIKSFVRGNIGSLSKDTFGNFVTRKVTTTYAYDIQNIRISSAGWPGAKVNQHLRSTATMQLMARSINNERPKFPVVNPYWREQLVADATNMSLIWGRLRTFVGKL